MKVLKRFLLTLFCIFSMSLFSANARAADIIIPFIYGGPNWGAMQVDMIPGIDDTYDIGSANFRWQDLFVVSATVTKNAIGVTPVDTNGVMISNLTAAAAGAQQWSPPLTFQAQGWRTNATAESQKVEFMQDVRSVQGAAAPTGYWGIYPSIADGAYSATPALKVQSDGTTTVAGDHLATSYTSTSTSSPSMSGIDSDQDDPDVTWKIYGNATATGTGAEVADLYFQALGAQGTAGSLETFIHFDGSEQTTNMYGTVLFPDGFTRHLDIEAGSAIVGNTAPTATTVGFARGLGFDADAELAFFNWEVPQDWDGVSDFTIEVIWFSTSGDAVQNGETVKLDLNYYSVAEGEPIDNGTPVEATTTYTASGNQTDKEMFDTTITIDFDHGDQPLTKDDTVTMQFNRDTGVDTYTGAVIVLRWEVKYTATGMPYH